jgi:hypothetical protein
MRALSHMALSFLYRQLIENPFADKNSFFFPRSRP